MIVLSWLNQKGGVGKTTLSIHVATALSRAGTVLLVDADPQGSALDWQEQRAADGAFPVIGLAKTRLHREIPVIGRHYDWVVIDGPPRANDLAKSAIAASDLVLIPVQPSPFDVWAAQDILTLVEECAVLKPVDARFVVNRLFLGTRLGAEVRDALAAFSQPVLTAAIRNRTEYAAALRVGQTALDTKPSGPAARDIMTLTDEIRAIALQEEDRHVQHR